MGFAILYLTLPLFLGWCLYYYLYKWLPNIRYRKSLRATLKTFVHSERNVYDGVRKLKREYRYLIYIDSENNFLTFKDILDGNFPGAENSSDRMSRHQAFHVKLFIQSYRPINYLTEELYWPLGDVESRLKFLEMLQEKADNFFYDR